MLLRLAIDTNPMKRITETGILSSGTGKREALETFDTYLGSDIHRTFLEGIGGRELSCGQHHWIPCWLYDWKRGVDHVRRQSSFGPLSQFEIVTVT